MTGRWTLAAGEYAFYNGGAWLGDVPTPRLFEIAYFLLYRETVRRIDTEDMSKARARSENRLDAMLRDADTDDESGLPAWVMASGVGPADGSPFT